MRNITLRNQLYLLAGMVTLLMAALGGVASWQLGHLAKDTKDLSSGTAFFIGLSRILDKASVPGKIIEQTVLYLDPTTHTSFRIRIEDLQEDVGGLYEQAKTEEDRAVLQEVKDELVRFEQAAERVYHVLENEGGEQAAAEVPIAEEHLAEAISLLRALKLESTEGLGSELQAIEGGVSRPVQVILVASCAMGLFALVLTMVAARRITQPLVDLREAINQVAVGADEVNVPVQSDDEVGGLALAFNRMADQVRDRTERHMQERVETAEIANRAKSEFLANISHELRTPLNSILGYSELLADRVKEEEHREYLDAVTHSGQGLLALIDDILDLSKIEAGAMDIINEEVDIRALVGEIGQIYHLKAMNKHLELKVIVDPELPQVIRTAPSRLRQIVVNLVGNAIKFTEEGEVAIRVEQRFRSERHIRLGIGVEDTGIGIPAGDIERIFGAFVQQQGQDDRKYGGTGLGLAISRQLAELMGGSLVVASEVGRGTHFQVELPEIEIVEERVETAPEAIDQPDTGPELGTYKVMVVEDNELNRKLVGNYLRSSGIQVIEAENGEIAVQEATANPPDAIIMDLQMPVMNGLVATEQLRRNPRFREVPIIALTANVMKEDREEALAVGFTAFITKPAVREDVLSILQEYLRPLGADGEPETEHMSPEEYDHLIALQRALQIELAEEWREISAVMAPAEIREFGTRVKKLGYEHGHAGVENWGAEVERYANRFRIDELEKALARFPQLVDELAVRTGAVQPVAGGIHE